MFNQLIKAVSNNKFVALQIGVLAVVSFLLRFTYLGYSNFQGDEINTLCRLSNYETLIHFLRYLLGQRKGPLQFLITCTYSIFDPNFSSELALRLPFAAANFLAVVCFFILVYRLFSFQIAIYSSFLFATNGIFIAFARIVQYQSFVILGVVLGILGLTMGLQYEKWRVAGLYLGFTSAAIGLLGHFDAVFVLPPMAVLVIHWWRKFHDHPDFAQLRRHLIVAVGIFTFLVLAFYIEYALQLGSFQTDYWSKRLAGVSTNIFRIFQFYNPGPGLWIYIGTVILGLTRIRKSIGLQVTLSWILPPLIFMEIAFKDSRTHAYTYLLPALIVAGMGFDAIADWTHRFLRTKSDQVPRAMILTVLLILSCISFTILVDHVPEYPWYPKQVLGVEHKGGYLAGTFGFPYRREWREIARWFDTMTDQEVVLATNEKVQIPTFYLPSKVRYNYISRDFPEQIETDQGLYVLIIQRPQSWLGQLWGKPVGEWHENLNPLHDFVNEEGMIVASIYFLTPDQIEAEFHN